VGRPKKKEISKFSGGRVTGDFGAAFRGDEVKKNQPTLKGKKKTCRRNIPKGEMEVRGQGPRPTPYADNLAVTKKTKMQAFRTRKATQGKKRWGCQSKGPEMRRRPRGGAKNRALVPIPGEGGQFGTRTSILRKGGKGNKNGRKAKGGNESKKKKKN